MEVTESELFEGDKGDCVRLEEGKEMDLTVSYSAEKDRRKEPYLKPRVTLTIKRSERTGSYITKCENRELRACSDNPLRTIAEIIEYTRETYNYTEYCYKTYSYDGEVEHVRIYQNDEILFRVGRMDKDKNSYNIEKNTFSYDFWDALYRTEYRTSRTIEKVDHQMIGIESIRIPVKKQIDPIEKELIVQINKYLMEFYKNNNVLNDDISLHKFIGFASLYTGRSLEVTNLTLHYKTEDD